MNYNNQNPDDKPTKRWRPNIFVIILNLVAMIAILLLLGWLSLTWMNVWTGHGEEQVVPNVEGQHYDAAVDVLLAQGLKVELSDSVYDDSVRPGVVVDQNPKEGAKVKEGRVIYLTVNAFSPKTVTLPRLTDMSARQARSILTGLGFKNVTEVPVVSEYKDLVLGARYDNKRLSPGARVPVSARITLEVGDGMPDLPDSVLIDTVNNGMGHGNNTVLELL